MSIDPREFLADLSRRAHNMIADAERQSQALRAAAAQATSGSVSVLVGVGGRLLSVEFDDRQTSVAQLGTYFSEAYEAACRQIVGFTAAHSGGLDDAILSVMPESNEDSMRRPASSTMIDLDPPLKPRPTTTSSDAFDAFLAVLDRDDDPFAFVATPEVQALRPGGDPDTWQQDLQRQVQAVVAKGPDIAQAARRAIGVHDDRYLHLEAAAQGEVRSLTFHQPSLKLDSDELADKVMSAYLAATSQAQGLLDQALDELGLSDEKEL